MNLDFFLKMTITVTRVSDGESYTFEDITPENKVKELKQRIRDEFPPAHEKGCRLIFNDDVLKSRKRLRRCDVEDGATITMDDSKNWSDDSSSSGSATD